MEPALHSRIDRYLNRELHPAAARALAHEALDDSDLFEELTAVALARAALDSPQTTDRALAQSALDDEDLFETLVSRGAIESSLEDPAFHAALRTTLRRKRWTIAVASVAAAAAAGLLAFYFLRSSSQLVQQPTEQARTTISLPAVSPQVLLASDLQPARTRDAPVFRGAGAASRLPRSEGQIVSIEDGIATVNLGSLDGLAKGVDLPVVRDRQIGRMVITTVFRDRARGKIVSGEAIGANDSVRVPSSAHLNAILQQVDALAASDHLKAARDLAQKSLTGGKPGETRQLLERLAALDYRAGAADAARERYEVAVNNFDQAPAASSAERATALNSLGSLLLMRGDLPRAEETLQRALAKADADPSLTTEILNNLGAAAEARGDLTKAREYYGRALTGRPSDIVRTNLARVNSAKHP